MTDDQVPETHNFDDFTDLELTILSQQVKKEQEKRRIQRAAEEEAREAVTKYQETVGREDGQEWVQPTSYLDVYMRGETVTRDGRTWTSNIDGNTLDPLVSGWTEVMPEGGYPVWRAPAGYQDAYEPGVIVWHPDEGDQLYVNAHSGANAWEPGTPHSQWEAYAPEGNPS